MVRTRQRARRSSQGHMRALYTTCLLAMATSMADAQSCVSLSGSTACPAFNMSSISTSDPGLMSTYPFLSFVTSTEDFDRQLNDYVKLGYVRSKYQDILGCSSVDLKNTTAYYARFTLSTICNAIVQNSIKPCQLSSEEAPPLCAATCAQQAESEEQITMNRELCGTPGDNYVPQIRADFTNCALPADSLSGSCVNGEENEMDECGFSTNLGGLCNYCGASSPNATDSCCAAANVTQRCEGVTLPSIFSLPPLFTSSSTTSRPTSSPSATSAPAVAQHSSGLSPGAIAGIVIGSLVGAALLLGLIFAFCVCLRRRRGSQYSGSKHATNTAVVSPVREKSNQPPPGGRIARMTALEGSSNEDRSGLDPMLAAEKRRYDQSDSDPYGESTPSHGAAAVNRRRGSLSSNSALGAIGATTGEETTSLSGHGGHYSSPGDVTSGQSEQLTAFKDYYSSDNIHVHDKVAVLWAYQPRAQDEFELQRGDMLRIVGIWDDGWATGVRLEERADDWTGKHQRDSGISGHDHEESPPSPLESGEVRAFPLVCVCLPEHWRKTIEGDTSTDSMSPPPDRRNNEPRNNEPFSQF